MPSSRTLILWLDAAVFELNQSVGLHLLDKIFAYTSRMGIIIEPLRITGSHCEPLTLIIMCGVGIGIFTFELILRNEVKHECIINV